MIDSIGLRRLFYGFFIPYFYIQIYANFRGVPPHIAKYLLAIMNATNVPSRILPGYVADKVGPYVFPFAVFSRRCRGCRPVSHWQMQMPAC